MTNSENNHSGWIFLAGLTTGAAVGYLINSDRGRQLCSEAANKAAELTDEARNIAQDKYSNAASTVTSIIEKGKVYAAEVSSKLLEIASHAAQNGVQKVEDEHAIEA
ncbi:MAG: YtxH domain-containing protein [Saprospiraceae bacterium]|nr:YtxH domain-containing protein [Saprospiraceae bacterium]